VIYAIANDPSVRAHSFNSDPIPYEDHARWFAAAMNDPERACFLVEHGPDTVGYVRFDGDEISIALAPHARGRGLGVSAIRAAIDASGKPHVIAYVLEGNEASVRTFERAGFKRTAEEVRRGRMAYRFEYDDADAG
jgi:UDP-2,4-diacetamido-2,4,6-trideoxy-beta-L-altropyranose hydrolase